MTGKSPAELFLGRKIRSTLDLIKPDIRHFEHKFVEKIERRFNVNGKVFVRNYKSKEKWVPGIVVGKIGSYLYDVSVGDIIIRRHIDQIIRNCTKQTSSPVVDDYISYDFEYYDYEDPEPRPYVGIPRRRIRDSYPVRIRKPVNRYGMS